MFALYITVENRPGILEVLRHGTYPRREDAEQIGQNLQLMNSWVKKIEVRSEAAPVHAPVRVAPIPPRKMARSSRKTKPARKRRSS